LTKCKLAQHYKADAAFTDINHATMAILLLLVSLKDQPHSEINLMARPSSSSRTSEAILRISHDAESPPGRYRSAPLIAHSE
jgi:hypothetical protein